MRAVVLASLGEVEVQVRGDDGGALSTAAFPVDQRLVRDRILLDAAFADATAKAKTPAQ